MSKESDNESFVRRVQVFLGVEPDGWAGPNTNEAFDDIVGPSEVHHVKASSFADPADVRAFQKCKAQGKSDMECFKVGDNGIGTGELGGLFTAQEETPMCALPPDDMIEAFGSVKNAKGAQVEVTANGKTVVCLLADRMPWKKNIKNGAGIDLNPAAAKQLGLKPPFMVAATWKWL